MADPLTTNNAAKLPQPQAQAGGQTIDQSEIDLSNDVKKQTVLHSLVSNTFNIGECLAAAPLIPVSLILQADNISKQGRKYEDGGIAGFTTMTIDVLSSVFRFALNKLVTRSGTEDDVSGNRRASLTQGALFRFFHPNINKEFTSLLFNMRRVLFNLFPNTFTVPSADHDPLNPVGNHAFKSTASLFSSAATITSPLRFIASVAGGLTTIPSHLFGSIYAYLGKQKLYETTKYFNQISEIFAPLVANLSSLYSVSKAYLDSAGMNPEYSGSKSKTVCFGRYNIGFSNIVQGLFGSALSIPYFFGVFGKLRDIVMQTNQDGSLKITEALKDVAVSFTPQFKALKLFPEESVDEIQIKIKNLLDRFFVTVDKAVNNFLSSIYNSNNFTKGIFENIRAKDYDGNILSVESSKQADVLEAKDKYFTLFDTFAFKKSTFFKEIFDLLHPLQSMLMLLPNAFVPISDPYVADNAKWSVRALDRLFGMNSMLLSLPNYIIYGVTTRLPQLLLKWFESQQRLAEIKGKEYDAHQHYKEFSQKLRGTSMFGGKFLANVLDSLDVNQYTFEDDAVFEQLYEKLDDDAGKQEPTVKGSELLQAARIGLRTMLARRWSGLFVERDEQGLTDEEHSKLGMYKWLASVQTNIGRIPILGWVASPLIGTFKALYRVDVKKNRNLLPSQLANKVSAPAAMNPDTALAA